MSGIQGSVEGISSSLNTSAIVDALLTFEKRTITLLEYDQTVKTNQIATYQAINTKLLAFQTQAALLSRADTFAAASVNVSDEDYLTAIAGDNVGFGTYALNITALAQNHQIASQGFSAQEAANIGTGSVTITVGDASPKTITIASGNNTLEGLKNAINSANVGVRAALVNDGTSSNPYRLILTANKTGVKNRIAVASSLTGSKAPDFTGVSFDQVEKLSFSANATSNPVLGTTASYSGSQNKTYSFTVGGVGTQTVGLGDITLNWSDGTNSGSIIVSSADTEVELSGAGSDGLKLQFSAGTLTAGDTFQVQAFAPLLQQAQDAKISMGSTSGGGSPITVTSETNFVTDLIPGVTLNLKKVTDSSPVTINVERNSAQIEQQVDDFISKLNDAMDAIDEQFKYDSENTENTGILFGDRTLLTVQNSLRSRVTSKVEGIDSSYRYRMLADIGIRIGTSGKLSVVDRNKLQAAIKEHTDDLQKLFAASGTSTNGRISFVSLTDKTKTRDAGYDVDITQVARQGYLRGASVADPAVTPLVIGSANKNLSFKIDGVVSETIALTEKTYSSFSALVTELQQKINADAKIGALGIEVGYFDNGSDGYITITSGSYGTSSKVEIQTGTANSAFAALGLATGQSFSGQDVAGTINGEKATGVGQSLTGVDGNANTAGLKLKVELTENDLVSGSEGTVKVLRGIASRIKDFADSLTKSIDGTLARRTQALQKQIDAIKTRIDEANELMELKRQRLAERFLEMEDVIGKLNSESTYLSLQLANLANLFGKAGMTSGTVTSNQSE